MTMAGPDHKARKHAMHNASSANFWLDCALWYKHKLAAEESGKAWDTSSAAAERGTALHEIAEFAAKLIMREQTPPNVAILQAAEVVKSDFVPNDDDLEQVQVAVNAMADVLRAHDKLQVALEAKAPLPYEPTSHALADVVAWNDDVLLILDYKFGRGEVSPDSAQLKIYGFALYERLRERMMEGWSPRIKLGIIQPALRSEAIVHEMSLDDLWDFQSQVEQTVATQINGTAKHGASDISTCEWCPAVKACGHYKSLAGGLIGAIEKAAADEGLYDDPDFVERIAVNASVITKIVAECKEIVAGNESEYPDWQRARVSNPGKWNTELLDEAEIAHRLRLLGADEVYRLDTPGALKKRYPKLSGTIDEFLLDQGHHIRLKYTGDRTRIEAVERERPPAPSFVAMTEAVERAMGKSESPQEPKATAKKQASKKQTSKKQASKKRAAKSAAPKKRASKKKATK